MSSLSGKERRLARLRSADGSYLWLALDHGLTFGPLEGLEVTARLAYLASLPLVTGVVVNRGAARVLSPTVRPGLVLQTFGGPLIAERSTKQPLIRIEEAVSIAADAVAVELNLNASNRDRLISDVASMIGDAWALGMPVLTMATALTALPPDEAVRHVLRVAEELGADVIKVGLPDALLDASPEQWAAVKEAVLAAPPILFAGGGRGESFDRKLRLARDLGFQGVCVGRNIFQHSDPAAAIRQIAAVFGAETISSWHVDF